VLGVRVTKLLREMLSGRREETGRALEALKLQYPAYALALERRVLGQSVLRAQELEHERLLSEGLLGPELYNRLQQQLGQYRSVIGRLPHLDVGLDTRELVDKVPLFANL